MAKEKPDNQEKKNDESQIPKREIRDFSPEIGELRIGDGDEKKLVGYAAKYGNFYDLGWFIERIKNGAFDDVLADDVRCLFNHDPNHILGRTASGTLQLESNSIGLKFINDLPDTSTGRDTAEEIRRGDISGCSFAFTVAEDDWKYFDDDRPSERTIVKIGKLFDVGPVVYPANPKTSVVARDTDVARRSLDEFKKQDRAAGDRDDGQEQETVDETKKLSIRTTEEKIDADKKAEKEKCERRQEIEKGGREAACINKRVTDQINAIKNKSAEV